MAGRSDRPTQRPARRQHPALSRREQQIMDVVYRRGEATAADVMAELPDAPGYSAVRTLLRILEDKGHLKHRRQGARYVYLPSHSRERAARWALGRLMRTFFDNSASKAVAALLDAPDINLSRHELDRLAGLIREARKEGR